MESAVIDRGEQDVWKILDAVGSGKVREALQGVDRLLSSAADPVAARLSFFALLAGFARQLAAIGGQFEAGVVRPGEKSYSRFNKFQEAIADGRPNTWRCRAGSRYLYVCEDGLVHYCSQQRGYPGVRLEEYGLNDIRREYLTEKTCAPTCTVSCVHQVSLIDFWRAPQTLRPSQTPDGLVQID